MQMRRKIYQNEKLHQPNCRYLKLQGKQDKQGKKGKDDKQYTVLLPIITQTPL